MWGLGFSSKRQVIRQGNGLQLVPTWDLGWILGKTSSLRVLSIGTGCLWKQLRHHPCRSSKDV